MHLNRREFVIGCGSTAILTAALPAEALARAARAFEAVRITRIVGFDLRSQRNKVAGKNARLDVHGDSATDAVVRIYTNQDGLEGLGVCWAGEDRLRKLLGRSPGEFLDPERRAARDAIGNQTMPLWDLVARSQNQRVCELLGAPTGEHRIPAYDASIYFADLLPEFASAWEDRFRREIDMGLAMGHRAFKVKVGRGGKWMPRAEGDARDVAVLKVIRAHAGKDVAIGVDANNGYDLAGTKKFIDATADVNLLFVEEMFPETVDECLALKEHMRTLKLPTLLADGETQGEPAAFTDFIAREAIDVVQGDMNRFGVEGILEEAAMAKGKRTRIAPHNWGSLMGFYQQLQMGPALPQFFMAEHDPLSTDVVVAEGLAFKDGKVTVPSGTGFGVRVNEEAFKKVKVKFDLKT
jgi:L-alanine-DL-glutamate epimerase-like enolase superfamily enzyme